MESMTKRDTTSLELKAAAAARCCCCGSFSWISLAC